MVNRNLQIVSILFFIFSTITISFGQDYSIEAKEYFSKYLDTKSQAKLLKESLPSVGECKLIFKNNNAYTFFGFVEDMKSSFDKEQNSKNETFVDCKIESFTTSDIENEKGNYAGGMKSIKNKLQKNVTFYQVTYLRKEDAEHGLSYNYFVNIKGNWVFIPKPWRVLK